MSHISLLSSHITHHPGAGESSTRKIIFVPSKDFSCDDFRLSTIAYTQFRFIPRAGGRYTNLTCFLSVLASCRRPQIIFANCQRHSRIRGNLSFKSGCTGMHLESALTVVIRIRFRVKSARRISEERLI